MGLKVSDYLSPWKVSDFKKVNKSWGNYRKVIGEIDVDFIDAIIYLMKENDDGRLSIAMHAKDSGKMYTKVGFYFVDTNESMQRALDEMYKIFTSLV